MAYLYETSSVSHFLARIGVAMSAVQSHEPTIMTLTPNAAEKVKSLSVEEGNKNVKLRVYVTGGGCSGFQYGFSFDEAVNEDDTVVSSNGADIIVDPLSYQYLVGSNVDYVEDLQGAKFVVKNPLASSTCGCGSSFSI